MQELSNDEIFKILLKKIKNHKKEKGVLCFAIILHTNLDININKFLLDQNVKKAINSASGKKFSIFAFDPTTEVTKFNSSNQTKFGELSMLPVSNQGIDELSEYMFSKIAPNESIKLPTLLFFNFIKNEEVFFFSKYIGSFTEDNLLDYIISMLKYSSLSLNDVSNTYKKNSREILINLERGIQQKTYWYRGKDILNKYIFLKAIFGS